MSSKTQPRKSIDWSHNLAYAVGLIATDGSLSNDRRHIVFTSTDHSLVEIFKDCLSKKNKIAKNPAGGYSCKPVFRIQVGDVALYNWLIKIGLSPNKSLTLGKIDVPDKFFPDLLRGLLDGDGSIIYYKDYYNTVLKPKYVYDRLFVYLLSASKMHLDWLQSSICRLKGLKGSLNNKPRNARRSKQAEKMYLLKFSTREAKKLLKWLYYKPGLPCLDRKWNIAKRHIEDNILLR